VKVIDNMTDLEKAKLHNLVLALGNFDGVHLGHRKLIEEAVGKAEEINSQAAVVTFDPHPLKILAPERIPKLLTTLDQRLNHFAELGIDIAVLLPFTRELAKLPPGEFVENILIGIMKAAHVCVGFNYTFGSGGKGGPVTLRELGSELGFGVSVVEPQRVNGVIVSSTEIRGALERGDVEEAAQYLGYRPSVPGIVVSGERRGRTIGFPTANVKPPEDLLVPARGVYAAWVGVEGEIFPSMVNIGLKPTFKTWGENTIEAHIFDFDRDIYGQKVEIFFRSRLRNEQKFRGIDELFEQLRLDRKAAYKILINDKIPAFRYKKQILSI